MLILINIILILSIILATLRYFSGDNIFEKSLCFYNICALLVAIILIINFNKIAVILDITLMILLFQFFTILLFIKYRK